MHIDFGFNHIELYNQIKFSFYIKTGNVRIFGMAHYDYEELVILDNTSGRNYFKQWI